MMVDDVLSVRILTEMEKNTWKIKIEISDILFSCQLERKEKNKFKRNIIRVFGSKALMSYILELYSKDTNNNIE